MKTIILINGAKRSGKDFTASLLEEKLYAKKKISFATPLKQIMADTFGMSLEQMETMKNDYADYDMQFMAYPNNQPSVNFGSMNFRTLLQRFGTEGMKPTFGESVWADITANESLDWFEQGIDYVIIPDFRFNIESETIKALQSDTIKVVTLKIRNDDINTEDAHSSERELDDYVFDYTINNTGYSPNLGEYVDSFISTYL